MVKTYTITIQCEDSYFQTAVHTLAEILESELVTLGVKREIPLFDDCNGEEFTMASFILQEEIYHG